MPSRTPIILYSTPYNTFPTTHAWSILTEPLPTQPYDKVRQRRQTMAPRLSIPPVTRILLIALVALSFLHNLARWRNLSGPSGSTPVTTPSLPYLTLVPAACIFYPWTFLSAPFVEQNVVTLLINGTTIFLAGKYLERAWGTREFGKAVVLCTVISNLAAVPLYILWAAVMSDPSRAQTALSGGVTLQALSLVAFKQLVPEHTVAILRGLIKMRVKHFPAVFLLLNTSSGFLFGTDTAAILAWMGLITSWTYLRFYKRQPDLSNSGTSGHTIRGDASETFALAMFFPDFAQPPIAFLCDHIYSILVNLRICTPFSTEEIAVGNEQVAARGDAGLPSLLSNAGRMGTSMGKREEAERRRALALRALDQRLNAASASKAPSQPAVITPVVTGGQASPGGPS